MKTIKTLVLIATAMSTAPSWSEQIDSSIKSSRNMSTYAVKKMAL